MTKYTDIMLDQEALGTTADAVIISIGAVRFNLESNVIDDQGFYASVSVDSNLKAKRRIDESTLAWWFQQGKDAQQVFFEAKEPLQNALESFADWVLDTGDFGKVRIWSNGASFDIPMLEHAYRSLGIESPWPFYQARCMRTYRDLPGAGRVERVNPSIAHNALHDALAQAKYVQAIHAELFGKQKALA